MFWRQRNVIIKKYIKTRLNTKTWTVSEENNLQVKQKVSHVWSL